MCSNSPDVDAFGIAYHESQLWQSGIPAGAAAENPNPERASHGVYSLWRMRTVKLGILVFLTVSAGLSVSAVAGSAPPCHAPVASSIPNRRKAINTQLALEDACQHLGISVCTGPYQKPGAADYATAYNTDLPYAQCWWSSMNFTGVSGPNTVANLISQAITALGSGTPSTDAANLAEWDTATARTATINTGGGPPPFIHPNLQTLFAEAAQAFQTHQPEGRRLIAAFVQNNPDKAQETAQGLKKIEKALVMDLKASRPPDSSKRGTSPKSP